jgi:NACalpha-BTF3-like transcription factor
MVCGGVYLRRRTIIMSDKKKQIPDVSEILESFDKKTKFSIKKPKVAKEKAMQDLMDNEEMINEAVYKDFSTITLGDYISAAHAFNREMMSSNLDNDQRAAYFTLFAFEERAKRISEHFTYIQ